jgi:O-methyltransferase involved in polyketide biosynthesis
MSESIIDAGRPNAGRMYDYYLGGHHNFEVDRLAAEQVIKLMPVVPKASRLQRWCLQDIAVELTEHRGFDVIIDFASGLPTQDHLHQIVPDGVTVIYSDHDPVVVEYAHEILQGTSGVHYFLADARHPEELLARPEVLAAVGERRRVAFVSWGIGMFLSDDEIRHMARSLYDWAAPGSCWAFNAQGADANVDDPIVTNIRSIYQRMGAPVYFRSLDTYRELVEPWKADAGGYVSLFDWHGFSEEEMPPEELQAYRAAGGGHYGTYLVK